MTVRSKAARFALVAALAPTGALVACGGGGAARRAAPSTLHTTSAAAAAAAGATGGVNTRRPGRCPAGTIQITGHFHGAPCVEKSLAHAAFVCNEAHYEQELAVYRALRTTEPGVLPSAFAGAARESAAVDDGAAQQLRRSGVEGTYRAHLLAHRAELVAFASRAEATPEASFSLHGMVHRLAAITIACVGAEQRRPIGASE